MAYFAPSFLSQAAEAVAMVAAMAQRRRANTAASDDGFSAAAASSPGKASPYASPSLRPVSSVGSEPPHFDAP